MNKSSFWSISCQHLLLSVFLILDILIGVWWCLVVLIYISLLTWYGTFFHLCICYLYIFSDEMYVQVFCSFFKMELFVVLVLHFKNSLYILDSIPPSDICSGNIFPQDVACLSILLTKVFKYTFLLHFYFSIECQELIELVGERGRENKNKRNCQVLE